MTTEGPGRSLLNGDHNGEDEERSDAYETHKYLMNNFVVSPTSHSFVAADASDPFVEANNVSAGVDRTLTPDLESRPISQEEPENMDSAFTTTTLSNGSSDGRAATPSSPPSRSSSLVNPATIPIRTSSTNAVANSSDMAASPESAASPRKHKSMASVPEEWAAQKVPIDEREWMSPTKQNRYTLPASIGASPVPGPSQTQSPTKPSLTRSTSSTTAMVVGLKAYQTIGGDMTNEYAQGWSKEKETILKGPFDYLESHPGKDIRTQMITAFNAWLQVPTDALTAITRIITMLHTASLLIDDVEDNSQLRRGVPVAHSIFGTAQTINSANYIYFCSLQEILALNNPAAIQIYTEELLNLHRGQGMDLFWRDTLTCPSEDDYLEMVGNKTGGLFRLAIKLMCAASPSHQEKIQQQKQQNLPLTNYVPMVNTIGLLFQILDDYRNLSDTTYTANKGLCEDLTEGKFSFPVIHAIRAAPENLVLINILKQKTNDDEVKRYAVAYMDRCGSFAYTRRVLRGLTKKAMQLVDEVDADNPGRAEGVKAILEKLRVDRHSREKSSG